MKTIAQIQEEIASEDPRIWGAYAACKGYPSKWWFAERYNSWEGQQSLRMAKRICSGCMVKDRCLQLANDGDEAFGIWGGLTPKERGYKRMNRVFSR